MEKLAIIKHVIQRAPPSACLAVATFAICVIAALHMDAGQIIHRAGPIIDHGSTPGTDGLSVDPLMLLDSASNTAWDFSSVFTWSFLKWLAPPNFGFVLVTPVVLSLVLINRLKQQRVELNLAPLDLEGKMIERVSKTPGTSPYDSTPRALLKNPYSHEFAELSLQERVAIAAEASSRAGRRIGTIVFRMSMENNRSKSSGLVEQPGRPMDGSLIAVDPILEFVRADLQQSLRPTDYVGIANGDAIVVFVSLLSTKTDLANIALRLHKKALRSLKGAVVSARSISEPGIAMYPLDGYDADDLFDAASWRAHFPISESQNRIHKPKAALPSLRLVPTD